MLLYSSALATKISPDHPVASRDNADIINKGNRYLDNREYQNALEYYEKIVSDPNLARAWSNKGLALLNLSKYEESLQAIEISIGLDPGNAHAWTNKGIVLHNLNRYNEAMESFQKSVDLNPQEFRRWDIYAICLIKEKRYDDAWKCLDKASELEIDSDSSAIVWWGKGDVLNNKQKYDEALACYDKAIEKKADFAIPWYEKGLILRKKQKYDEALACFDKAIECSKKSVIFSNETTGHTDGSSIKAIWEGKFLLLYELQRYDEALKSVDKLIEIDPNDSGLWAVRGRILNNLHRYDEAIVSLDRLLQSNPNHAGGWNNKGTALLEKGKYNEAITCFEKSMKLDPTNKTFSSNKTYAIKLRENKTKYYTSSGKPVYRTESISPSSETSIMEEKFLECVLPEYDMKINYPATWHKADKRDLKPPLVVGFSSMKESSSDTYLESIGISVTPIAPNLRKSLTPQMCGELAIDNTKKKHSNFVLLESTATTVGGLPAHQVVFKYGSKKFLHVFTPRADKVYQIVYVSAPEKYMKFLPIVEQMIASVEFKS